MFVPNLNQGPQTSLPDVTAQKFPSLIKVRQFQFNSTLWTFSPPALRSAPGNRKLTCYRESEKERQRERERERERKRERKRERGHHPWIRSIQSCLHLIPTETWPGLEFHLGLADWNTNLSHHRLWFPPETHYWFLSATPPNFIIAKVKMDNRRAHISAPLNNTALWQLSSTPLKRATPPEIIQWLHTIMIQCSVCPAPIMNTWIHKHKMGLWISIQQQLLSKVELRLYKLPTVLLRKCVASPLGGCCCACASPKWMSVKYDGCWP